MTSMPTTDALARRRSHLKAAVLAALAILNAAMALSLAGRLVVPNTAEAGANQAGRVSEYLMIPAHPLGVPQDVLYILDIDNARLVVAAYDQPNNRIDFVGPLPLRDMLNRQ